MERVLEKLEPYWANNPQNIEWPPRKNYYEWYAIWASLVKPDSYLEIGVMYGWSVMAILCGWPHIRDICIIDNELYKIPVEFAEEQIRKFRRENGIHTPVHIQPVKADSTVLHELPTGKRTFDLMHVDGQHSAKAAHHDLDLCLRKLSPKGTIIVDDIGFAEVKEGADLFLARHPELEVRFANTQQGHYLIWRRG